MQVVHVINIKTVQNVHHKLCKGGVNKQENFLEPTCWVSRVMDACVSQIASSSSSSIEGLFWYRQFFHAQKIVTGIEIMHKR